MKKIGRIIYSYRKVNGLSQEELAGRVGVSPAAVSKWERDLSLPDVEMICRLADEFEITADELLGRTKREAAELKFSDQAQEDRFCVATELLVCRSIAGNEGLLAVLEYLQKKEGSTYEFLKFAMDFIWRGFQMQMSPMEAKEFLLRYAQSEKDPRTAEMAAEGLALICSGENEEILREVLRSYLGRKYACLFAVREQEKRRRMDREEMIRYYSEASPDAGTDTGINTGLLEELLEIPDERLRRMLREISDPEFVRAMAGASPKVRERLFRNLSDNLIWLLGEALLGFAGGPEEVKEAQRRMLELLEE